MDKKLQLSKLQANIWEKTQNVVESFTLSDMDDDMMKTLLKKDVENSEQVYKFNK